MHFQGHQLNVIFSILKNCWIKNMLRTLYNDKKLGWKRGFVKTAVRKSQIEIYTVIIMVSLWEKCPQLLNITLQLSSVLVYIKWMECCGSLNDIDYKTPVTGYTNHVTFRVFSLGIVCYCICFIVLIYHWHLKMLKVDSDLQGEKN